MADKNVSDVLEYRLGGPIGVSIIDGTSNCTITATGIYKELRKEIDELRDMITAVGIENTFLKTKLNEKNEHRI